MKRWRLVVDAKRVFMRAWSVRLALVSAVFSAAEIAIPYLAPQTPSKMFASLAGLVALAAAVARIIAQTKGLSR